jgi:hypothetical protein
MTTVYVIMENFGGGNTEITFHSTNAERANKEWDAIRTEIMAEYDEIFEANELTDIDEKWEFYLDNVGDQQQAYFDDFELEDEDEEDGDE